MKIHLKWFLETLYTLKNKIESIAPYNHSFKHPIFIIAPPRSGSTFLFECLTQFDELHYLQAEADLIWWQHFPYEHLPEMSDYIAPHYATPATIQNIRRDIYQLAIRNHLSAYPHITKFFHLLPYLFGFKPIRYLDKTIANCFHLEFLKQAFPNAHYIFLVRDPRANISSMIESWFDLKRMGKPQLSTTIATLKEAAISHWAYPAPPGWQNVVSWPLAKICAWSWQQHIEYALTFFLPDFKNVITIRYESLVKNTLDTISILADKLNLNLSQKVIAYTLNPPLSQSTFSKPNTNKWKHKNYHHIMAILPMIKETATKIGYD